MFQPTIKYRRVNDPPQTVTKALENLDIASNTDTDNSKETNTKKTDKLAATEAQKNEKSPVVVFVDATSKKADEVTKKTETEQKKPAVDTTTRTEKPKKVIEVESKVKENIKSTETVEKKEAKVEASLNSFTFEEEEEESQIGVDPNDKDRIVITLSTGKQYTADRYCPHAGVDLSVMGQVSEHDYPPEIGPVLMCTYHYWEFALDKEGRGAYSSTINACPIGSGETCKVKKELEW